MDWPGILLLATFMNGAMAVIIWGSYLDWTTSPWICLAIASMVVAVPLFVWRELVTPQPVTDVRMFANRTVALAMISLGCYAAAYVGTLLILPGYSLLRGYPAFTTGLMMLPPSAVLLASLLTSGLISDRTHTVRTMQAGLVIIAVASWQLTRLDLYTSKYWIVAVLSVWTVGIGMVLPTALRLTFQGQTPEQVNRTGSIKTMLRLGSIIIGGNVGAVVVTRGTDWGLDHLGSNVTALDPAVIDTTGRLAVHMQHVGATVETAGQQADAVVGWWFHQNAAALGYQRVMWYFVALNAAGLVAALLIRAKPEPSILDTDDPTTLGGLLGKPAGRA